MDGSGSLFGSSIDPVQIAPAVIAIAVGLLVWRRHRVDRRAWLFLALAVSELGFALPMLLWSLDAVPDSPVGVAAIDGLIVTVGLLSATLFLHFGLSFPHARPWLRLGKITSFYVAALIVGMVPIVAALVRSQWLVQDVFDGVLMLVGPLVLVAAIGGCVAIFRSYREMTADERRTYRLPVMGVLVGMIASLLVSLVLGLMFGLVVGTDNRYIVWSANTIALAGELLLPLFFFMASHRYRLLERHSPDYVSRTDTARRR